MAVPNMTNNSPTAGKIAWDLFHIQYEGVGYEVPAGNTADRWVWWKFNGGSPTVVTGAEIPEDLTADDLVLFGNKNGIAIRIQNSNLIDGELIVNGSILSEALHANIITSEHIVTLGLDAGVIKFGVMSGDRIEANTITAEQIAAHTITAEEIAADTITANEIAADTITAEQIASRTITAEEIAADTITANEIAAETITAEEIAVDSVTSAIINTKIIQSQLTITGNIAIDGGNMGWSKAEGLYLGDDVVFYGDDRTNRVEGDLITENIVVKDGLSIGGNADLHGTMVASNGVPNPSSSLSLSQTWKKMVGFNNDGATDNTFVFQDMIEHTDLGQWISCFNFFGAGFRLYNKSDLSWGGDLAVGSWAENYYPNGGTARVGTSLYTVGSDKDRQNDYYIYRISANGATKQNERRVGSINVFANKNVRLISDGTRLGLIFASAGAGNLLLRWYSADLSSFDSDILLMSSVGQAHIGGAHYGRGQSGGPNRIWVSLLTGDSNMVRCFTTAGVRVASEDFPRAANATVMGLSYDSNSERMVSYDKFSTFYTYSKYVDGGILNAQETWYDGDNSNYPSGTVINGVDVSGTASGPHETPPSPVTSFNLSKRAWPVIVGFPAPDELVTSVTQVDKADRVGIYAAIGATPVLQSYLAKGVRALPITDDLVTSGVLAGASTVPSFATAAVPAPGRWQSAAQTLGSPTWDLPGSGAGRTGPHRWDVNSRPLNHGEYSTVAVSNCTTGNWFKRIGWAQKDSTNSPANGITYSNGDFTVSQSGLYLISAAVAWNGGAAGSRIIGVYINGVIKLRRDQSQGVSGNYATPTVSDVIYLAAGSVIAVQGLQGSGGTLAWLGNDEQNSLSIECLAAF